MPAAFPVPKSNFGVERLDDLTDVDTAGAERGSLLHYAPPYWFSRGPDRINARDYMSGAGDNTVDDLIEWIDKVQEGYGTTPSLPATTRLGWLPGGIFRGDGTADSNIRLTGYATSLRGDGPISQIINAEVSVESLDVHVESLRLVGDGAFENQGIGLNILANHGRFSDVNAYRKAVGISNTKGLTGVFPSNLTLFGGWIRECTTGVEVACPDYRAFGQRISGGDVAFHYYDSGGIELVGCWLSSLTGPSLKLEGKRVDFAADGAEGGQELINIVVKGGDFSTILPGDVINSLGELTRDVFQPNTRVVTASLSVITLDRPMLKDTTQNVFAINETPIESFFVGVTVGSGANHRFELEIESITDPSPGSGAMLVTFTQEHRLSYGMTPVTFVNTGVASYDDTLANRGRVLAVPSSKSVVVSFPYDGDIAPPVGTTPQLRVPDDSAQFLSVGPNTGNIQAQFFTGGNHNGTAIRGAVGLNFFGTRLKRRRYMYGCRPFKGDVSTVSDVITNITIPTSEIRLGTRIALGTVIPTDTMVVEIPGPGSALAANSIRIDKLPLQTATQVPIFSPDQPNHILHFAPYDTQGPGAQTTGVGEGDPDDWLRMFDVKFCGPGSLLGWSQIGGFATVGREYHAVEGDEEVGILMPYTRGGLLNNQPAILNKNVMMNNGWRLHSNGVHYDVQGGKWYINPASISLRAGNVDPYGTTITDDVEFARFSSTGAYLTLPTADPHVLGELWIDTAAGRVIKSSAG